MLSGPPVDLVWSKSDMTGQIRRLRATGGRVDLCRWAHLVPRCPKTAPESVAVYSDAGPDAPLEPLVTIASLLSPDFDEVTACGTAFSQHILLELTNLAPGLSDLDAPPYLSLTIDATTDARTLYVFRPDGSPPVRLEPYAALSTFEPN